MMSNKELEDWIVNMDGFIRRLATVVSPHLPQSAGYAMKEVFDEWNRISRKIEDDHKAKR